MDQSYEEMCQEKARAAGSFSSGLAGQQTTARFDKNPEVARILDLMEEVGR